MPSLERGGKSLNCGFQVKLILQARFEELFQGCCNSNVNLLFGGTAWFRVAF